MTEQKPAGKAAAEDQARYNWITPRTFGELIGGEKPASASHVRNLIRRGSIRSDMVIVVNPGSSRPDYRINPRAADLFRRDHSLAARTRPETEQAA